MIFFQFLLEPHKAPTFFHQHFGDQSLIISAMFMSLLLLFLPGIVIESTDMAKLTGDIISPILKSPPFLIQQQVLIISSIQHYQSNLVQFPTWLLIVMTALIVQVGKVGRPPWPRSYPNYGLPGGQKCLCSNCKTLKKLHVVSLRNRFLVPF